jgi:hypothetical protein
LVPDTRRDPDYVGTGTEADADRGTPEAFPKALRFE